MNFGNFEINDKMKMPTDEDAIVKISYCSKCEGIVRSSIEQTMNRKSKLEFAKEVMIYNLSVKSMPLLEYRKLNWEWCKC